jgi:hypothetical protein
VPADQVASAPATVGVLNSTLPDFMPGESRLVLLLEELTLDAVLVAGRALVRRAGLLVLARLANTIGVPSASRESSKSLVCYYIFRQIRLIFLAALPVLLPIEHA